MASLTLGRSLCGVSLGLLQPAQHSWSCLMQPVPETFPQMDRLPPLQVNCLNFCLHLWLIPIALGAQKTKHFLEEKMSTSRLKQSRVYSANTSTAVDTVLDIYCGSGLKPRLLGPSILIGSKSQTNRLFRCHMISAVEEGVRDRFREGGICCTPRPLLCCFSPHFLLPVFFQNTYFLCYWVDMFSRQFSWALVSPPT